MNKVRKKNILRLSAVLAITLLLCAGSCKFMGQKDSRPNVILISIDTLREDHCSVYGYHRDTTPNLRTFAGEGVKFNLAYSPTSTTGPSHATMFTSLYPITHRVIKNGLNLNDKFETLAEILSAQDYQTAAILSSFVLHSKFGYAQGFDFYDDKFKSATSTMPMKKWEGLDVEKGFDRRGDETTQRTINWLKKHRNSNRPFFLFVHYFDPHSPYVPPEPYASRFTSESQTLSDLEKEMAHYDGEIAFTDNEIGKLLATLKEMQLEEKTLIVITSDHGEGLMQRGHMGHGIHIYDEAVRVPFLLRWPGHLPKGHSLNAPVSLIDLAPTILNLIGTDRINLPFTGQDLAPALYGEGQLDKNRPIYLYRRHYKEGKISNIWVKGEKFAVRLGDYKYIEGKEENTKELFNLTVDPGELTNIYNTEADKAAELASNLNQWMDTHKNNASEQGKISPDDLQRLRTLGYVE